MRYKLKLVRQLKHNYVNLPSDSPLRQSLSTQKNYLSSHCQSIKVTSVQNNVTHYLGFTGGASAEENTIELSYEAGLVLNLADGSMVQCSIEYSYERLQNIELVPFSASDFEIIEQNSAQIEE